MNKSIIYCILLSQLAGEQNAICVPENVDHDLLSSSLPTRSSWYSFFGLLPVLCFQLSERMVVHCKKIGTLRNLKKRFGRLQKACKCVQSFKKRIKKYTEPLKDLTLYPSEDPFFFGTFSSSVDQKIGFVGKYETFRVS